MDLRSKILPVLRRMHDVTVGDVAQATGLTATDLMPALWTLVAERHGFVDVAEGGAVRFRFPPELDPTRHEKWDAMWKWAWRLLKAAYKVGITVFLVAYFLVFIVVMIALLVASLSNNSGSSSSKSFNFSFLNIFNWGESSSSSTGSLDRWDRSRSISGRVYAERSMTEKIYAFVFGEEEPPVDPHELDAQAVAYAREHEGLLTATEMVALRGQSLAEAARDAARLAFQNDGSASVTDGGTFLYDMRDLVVSATDKPPVPTPQSPAEAYWARVTGTSDTPVSKTEPYCWTRVEPELPFNDNSPDFNLGITCVNFFNLVWSGIFTFHPEILPPAWMWAAHLLGPVPFVFSSLFFIIPIVRAFWLHRENRRRTERNEWRGALHRLFEKHVWRKDEKPVTVDTLSGGALDDPEAWKRRLATAVKVFHGREVEGGGYVFDALRQDTEQVTAAREGTAHIETRLGPVVLSTETEPQVIRKTSVSA
jgi:hypothetical protein